MSLYADVVRETSLFAGAENVAIAMRSFASKTLAAFSINYVATTALTAEQNGSAGKAVNVQAVMARHRQDYRSAFAISIHG